MISPLKILANSEIWSVFRIPPTESDLRLINISVVNTGAVLVDNV